MTGKPKKTEEAYSNKPSAKSHRTKNQLYARLGFSQKKIFLGDDALKKLRFLIRIQHGENINDQMVMSDVLSYCINTCYNLKSVQAKVRKRGSLPKIRAAKTPEGQRLYRYYQMAQVGDALELLEAFNARGSSRGKGKQGKPYFPHMDDIMAYVDLGDLYLDDEFWEGDDEEDLDEDRDAGVWTTVEIQALRNRKAISKAIKDLNEQAFPSMKKSSKTVSSSGSDEEDCDWL